MKNHLLFTIFTTIVIVCACFEMFTVLGLLLFTSPMIVAMVQEFKYSVSWLLFIKLSLTLIIHS